MGNREDWKGRGNAFGAGLVLLFTALPTAAQTGDRIVARAGQVTAEMWVSSPADYVLLAELLFALGRGESPVSVLPDVPAEGALTPARTGQDPAPMIGGPHPLFGYGGEALRACAPEGGGAWSVEVVKVTEASLLYPDQDPPPGTLQEVVTDGLPVGPDLVVVVFETGGLAAGSIPVRSLRRRSCIVFAGHTAPETYWIMGSASFTGAPYADIVYRGLGHIGDRRINGGAYGANLVQFQCVTDLHADQLTVAFAENDMLSTSSGCGRNVTIARSICGPSAGGTVGRCGGLFGKPEHSCGEQTWAYVLGFENMRRNPIIGCGTRAPLNITNVVTFNSTDAGRIQVSDVKVNFRGILSIGGPVTGCDRDRAITWFDQSGREPSTAVYLESVRSEPAPGCAWSAVEALWGQEHTVFHRSVEGTPATMDRNGITRPHPDPRLAVAPLPLADVEEGVLLNAGANFRLECDGRLTRRVNALDAVSIRRVRARDFAPTPWVNIAEYESRYGPLEFPKGTPCSDANDNGIPDRAEAALAGSATAIADVGELNPATGRPWILDYLGGRGS